MGFSLLLYLQVAQLFASEAQPWAEENIGEIAGQHGEEQVINLRKYENDKEKKKLISLQ